MFSGPKRISSNLGELLIRPYEVRDIPYQGAYLYDSPRVYLEEIGYDPAKFLPREEWAAELEKRLNEAAERGDKPLLFVAELGGRAVSVIFLDLRNADGVPRLHFHIFEPALRGQGLGATIGRACLEEIVRIHGYHRFLLEPRASNKRINGLLRKMGCRYVQDLTVPAGPWTAEVLASQYEVIIES